MHATVTHTFIFIHCAWKLIQKSHLRDMVQVLFSLPYWDTNYTLMVSYLGHWNTGTQQKIWFKALKLDNLDPNATFGVV